MVIICNAWRAPKHTGSWGTMWRELWQLSLHLGLTMILALPPLQSEELPVCRPLRGLGCEPPHTELQVPLFPHPAENMH